MAPAATARDWWRTASNGCPATGTPRWPRRRFDALASNPPYIAADDPVLDGDGLRHEPRAALTPGGDGLERARHYLLMGRRHTCNPAAGCSSNMAQRRVRRCATALVARGFTHVTSHRDLAGHERVTEGKWPQR